MTQVVDASVLVAWLVDDGPVGQWAEAIVARGEIAAPHLVVAECANILRRAVLAGDVTADVASLAHADLLDLRMELVPYAPLASRVWALRSNLTVYDAWYVALAEALSCPLVTLDHKLSRATGPRCRFVTYTK